MALHALVSLSVYGCRPAAGRAGLAAGGPPVSPEASSGADIDGTAGVCRGDYDCQLNGVCTAGVCQCDAAWTGPQCRVMNLKPSPRNGGYKHPNTSSWGGNAWRDPDTNVYHGFFSEFVNHCGLSTWGTNSRIVHAEATDPAGPYKFADEALPPQAHNAHIAYDATAKLFLLYHIHVPDPTCVGPAYNCSRKCTNGSTVPPTSAVAQPLSLDDPSSLRAINWTYNSGALHTSASVYGPWLGERAPNVGCNNPSPFLFPNGSVLRACAGQHYYPQVDQAVSYLSNYSNTPAVNITCANLDGVVPMKNGFHSEDAVVWVDRRGNRHLLSHSVGPWADADGVHAYSMDGRTWNCSDIPPYNGSIPFDDGKTDIVTKRERPKLLFDSNGEPIVLFTAIVTQNHHVDDYSYTLATPIHTASSQ